MAEIEVQRCTRRCAKTDRSLEPGETVYSALIVHNNEEVRVDYSQTGWDGPPENAAAWWKHQLPALDDHKKHWAPHEVMLDYFERLENQPDKQDVRYIMALLLVRRRLVRLERSEEKEQNEQVMLLFCPSNQKEYQVVPHEPSAERVEMIQEELAKLLN